MSGFAFTVTIASVWLAIGLALSLVMNRRGYSAFSWLVLGTLLGPLAFVLAFDASHNEGLEPLTVDSARPRGRAGRVDVLVGYDGSPESLAALEGTARLLGDRLGRLTVATVVPFDNIAEPERLARDRLQEVSEAETPAAEMVTELKVLHGRPAEALRQWAAQEGYELIAVGSRGTGMSKQLLGSAAYELARGGKVPVLLVGDA